MFLILDETRMKPNRPQIDPSLSSKFCYLQYMILKGT